MRARSRRNWPLLGLSCDACASARPPLPWRHSLRTYDAQVTRMRTCCSPVRGLQPRGRHSTVCSAASGQRPAQQASSRLDAAAVVQRLVRCVKSRPEAGAVSQALSDAGQLIQAGALHSSQTALILWAAAKLNASPTWLPTAFLALRADMSDASFPDLCLSAWAVARLSPRHRPRDDFVADLWHSTGAHLAALTPLTASQLGFAVSAGLAVRPPDRWAEAYLQHRASCRSVLAASCARYSAACRSCPPCRRSGWPRSGRQSKHAASRLAACRQRS